MSEIRPGEVMQWLDEDADHVLALTEISGGSRDRITSTMWSALEMIRKQEAEIERLRAALLKIANWKQFSPSEEYSLTDYEAAANEGMDVLQQIARAALSGKGET